MKTSDKVQTLDFKKASLFKRSIAAILDFYISSVLANIPILFIYSIETGETKMSKGLSSLSNIGGILACLLGILMIFLYYIVLPVYKFDGQTLMKKILGFKVVKIDGSNVDLKTMVKREALGSTIVEGGFVSSGNYLRQLILIITGSNLLYTSLLYIAFTITIMSVIFMMFSKQSRAFHDYIGNTRVLSLRD